MTSRMIPNADMTAAWDGPEGHHWAAHARRYERTTRAHRRVLVEALDLAPDASVIDVGCGTGALTIEVGGLIPRGRVLGIDLSSRMLEVARTRARETGAAQIALERADAQVHPFPSGAADLVISCFGVMFFDDPVRAFRNLAHALRPGGGSTFLVWRELAHNEWVHALRSSMAMGRDLPSPPPGATGPFSLAEETVARAHLESAGFSHVRFTPVDEPVSFGTDPDDAFRFVSTLGITKGLLADLDDEERNQASENLRTSLVEHAGPDGVSYASAAWLIQATNEH